MSLWGKKKRSNFKDELEHLVAEPPVNQRVELLELEVTTLKEQLKELQRKLAIVEKVLEKFSDVEFYSRLSDNEKIYQYFDEGRDITELAKQFNKGKGEIELILNLRNLK